MINYFLKSQLYQKFKEFRSFIILMFLITFAIIIINTYDKFRSEQLNSIENILQNTYLHKTLESISNSLNPRFEKINFVIGPGENFNNLLNKINLDKEEKKKILDFILSNKIKFNLYENQKISFDIDNLSNRKIVKIVIPINACFANSSCELFYCYISISEPSFNINRLFRFH